jgi:hypothetical protein
LTFAAKNRKKGLGPAYCKAYGLFVLIIKLL